jgi:hypothetical protein
MSSKKQYRVTLRGTIESWVDIEAESQAEAEELADEIADESNLVIDNLDDIHYHRVEVYVGGVNPIKGAE